MGRCGRQVYWGQTDGMAVEKKNQIILEQYQ